jgi:hypothetical protein
MTTKTATARPAVRPMTTITATVADIRDGDYVETIGGPVAGMRRPFKAFRVGATVHATTRAMAGYHRITFMGSGAHTVIDRAPATFRRFTDV